LVFYRRMTHPEQKVFDVSKKFSTRRRGCCGCCVTSERLRFGASHYAELSLRRVSPLARATYRHSVQHDANQAPPQIPESRKLSDRGFTAAAAAAALGFCLQMSERRRMNGSYNTVANGAPKTNFDSHHRPRDFNSLRVLTLYLLYRQGRELKSKQKKLQKVSQGSQ